MFCILLYISMQLNWLKDQLKMLGEKSFAQREQVKLWSPPKEMLLSFLCVRFLTNYDVIERKQHIVLTSSCVLNTTFWTGDQVIQSDFTCYGTKALIFPLTIKKVTFQTQNIFLVFEKYQVRCSFKDEKTFSNVIHWENWNKIDITCNDNIAGNGRIKVYQDIYG